MLRETHEIHVNFSYRTSTLRNLFEVSSCSEFDL